MTGNKFKKLIIEYCNGIRDEIDFTKLSISAQKEIVKLSNPSLLKTSKNYLICEWKDGWREITKLNGNSVPIRYYVINRVEESGRIVIEQPGDYPELVIVNRQPSEIENLIFLNGNNATTYSIAEKDLKQEGDKIEQYYTLSKNNDDFMEYTQRSMLDILKNMGMTASQLLQMNGDEKKKNYKYMRKRIGLVAAENEHDVWDLLDMLLQAVSQQ